MSDSLYRRLQRQLDQFSMGFPEAASGIEIEILRSLFSETDAVLFTRMTPFLETPDAVAQRLHRPVDDVSRKLDDMAARVPPFALLHCCGLRMKSGDRAGRFVRGRRRPFVRA